MRSSLWILTLISVAAHLLAGAGFYFLSGSGETSLAFKASPNTPPTTLEIIPAPDTTVQTDLPVASAAHRPKVHLPTSDCLPDTFSTPPLELEKMLSTVSPAGKGTSVKHPALVLPPNLTPAPLALVPHLPALHLNKKDSVVFLIDVSGSMYEDYTHTTRLILAQQTLARMIMSLPDGTYFSVVQYGQKTKLLGPLVTANDETRDVAMRFIFEDFNLGGGTDLPAGFATAQRVHPDRMVLATDGELNMPLNRLMSQIGDILGGTIRLDILGIYPRENTDNAAVLQQIASLPHSHYYAQEFAHLGSDNVASNSPASTAP